VQGGRRLHADRVPAAGAREPKEHSHVAPDVEKATASGCVALDQLEFFEVVRIPVVRGVAGEDQPRFVDVLVRLSPVDLFRLADAG
jgi:hypothetical protein